VQLPLDLRRALDRELEGVSLSELAQASARITEQYRSGRPSKLATPVERLAYAAARMPATYAAVHAALLPARDLLPRTMLDLGAGPGTATWAASSVFPSLASSQLIERNPGLAELGRRLAPPIAATWIITDLTPFSAPPADLVVLSYALGELSAKSVLAEAWQSTRKLLALIEPGTPRGFALLREARAWLIAQGAHLVAPCPHAGACPITADDWCHFAARVERTSLHRRMKGATMGYEDEKFSYVLASRTPAPMAEGRILRHPQRMPGYVQLELCTPAGLVKRTVAKSAGLLHRAARKSSWGEAWPPKEKGEPEGSPAS
jgi:ribosomal protein RSM22 (predicted rRNA methylase)